MIAALIGVIVLLIIVFLGFPLGMSLMAVGYFGFAFVHPKGFTSATSVVGQQIVDLGLNVEFAVLPLFILMGVFITKAALSDDLYEAAHHWLGHFRGGLAMSTVAACGGLAAVSGSSAATAATMAQVAVPSMRKYKYADSLSSGTVAAGGTMGILIPPSAALIIYGLLSEQDIGLLFMAGVVPGIITILAYMAVIRIVTTIWPTMGPPAEKSSWKERWHSLSKVWGVVFLFILIMGGIFFGLFTSGEAGGIGAGGSVIFAMFRKKMTVKIFVESLIAGVRTAAMVLFVAFGALVFNQFINMSGMPTEIFEFIESLNISPMQVVLIILLFYIIAGMFIEGMAMIFLLVPILAPLMNSLGFDLIWWGIVTVMVTEIALITPPMGLNVFIIKAMLPDVTLVNIFKGIIPFFFADIVRLAIILIFPSVVMWLPNLMG